MATRRATVVGSDHTGSLDPEPAAPARPAVSAKRPDIKVTAAREEQRFVGPIPLAIGFIALAGVLSMALRAHSRAEDANFVSARDGVAQYELGRSENERNYDDPIYEDALASLARVEPGSNSAGAAQTLSDDIKHKRDLFRQRIRKREEVQAEVQQEVVDRDRESIAAHQVSLLTPKKEFPECKEGAGHAH
jgi:hypothetical protein